MQSGDQIDFAGNSDLNALQSEADGLIANILLNQIANKNIQNRTVSIAEKTLLNGNNQGKFKTWYKTKLVGMLPRVFNMLNKKLHSEETNAAADIGRLLTLQLMIKNHPDSEQTSRESDQAVKKATKNVNDFISHLDFGEVYDAVTGSKDQTLKMVDSVKQMLVENHTGKLAALTPTMVETTNLFVKLSNLLLADHKDLPPDFIADFTAGLMGLLDGPSIGKMLNNNNEMIRLINTGNKLQSEGEKTLFEIAYEQKATEVLKELDPSVYSKMKTGKAELSESFQKGLIQSLSSTPELLKKILEAKALVANSNTRVLKNKLSLLLNLSENDFSESISNYIQSVSTDDLSETVSLFISILSKTQETNPGLIGKFLSDLLTSIDTDDLEDISEELVKEFMQAISPLLSVSMPHIVNGVSDLLLNSIEDHPDELPTALSRLFGILKNGKEE